jgi:hypothetical protein
MSLSESVAGVFDFGVMVQTSCGSSAAAYLKRFFSLEILSGFYFSMGVW